MGKIKSFFNRVKSKIVGIAVGSLAVLSVAAIAASAEPDTSAADGLKEVISTAGTTLSEQFTTLVQTLVPVLIGIAVVGLGLYACIYLFKMAKKFFNHAAN